MFIIKNKTAKAKTKDLQRRVRSTIQLMLYICIDVYMCIDVTQLKLKKKK